MTMHWMIPASLAFLVASTAHADQCEWVHDGVAQRAQQLLAKHPTVIQFCEPCGEQAPGTPIEARTVASTRPQAGFQQLQINGQAIDLAYTYIKTSGTTYANLARLAGCPADGVSPTLAVADETAHGVLITASDQPVSIASEPAAPRVPMPIAPVYVYSTTTERLPWLALVLAVAAGFVLGAATPRAIAAVRRRRTMQPRASELGRSDQ